MTGLEVLTQKGEAGFPLKGNKMIYFAMQNFRMEIDLSSIIRAAALLLLCL